MELVTEVGAEYEVDFSLFEMGSKEQQIIVHSLNP